MGVISVNPINNYHFQNAETSMGEVRIHAQNKFLL